jgi:hypothetical protein
MWMACRLTIQRKVLVILFLQKKRNAENEIVFVVIVPLPLALEVLQPTLHFAPL